MWKANQVHLNFAKISLEKASGTFGFRFDAGTGRTVDIISAADDGPKRDEVPRAGRTANSVQLMRTACRSISVNSLPAPERK